MRDNRLTSERLRPDISGQNFVGRSMHKLTEEYKIIAILGRGRGCDKVEVRSGEWKKCSIWTLAT